MSVTAFLSLHLIEKKFNPSRSNSAMKLIVFICVLYPTSQVFLVIFDFFKWNIKIGGFIIGSGNL